MSMNIRRVEAVIVQGVELRPGARVKIKAKDREMDRTLLGKTGLIEAFEQNEAKRIQAIVRLEAHADFLPRQDVKLRLTLDEIEPV